jgi:large subunit ribosomal protein L10
VERAKVVHPALDALLCGRLSFFKRARDEMNREQKAATIEALATEIDGAEAVFAVDYRGISVSQAAELRTKLREADATFQVVKNSLTERAADQVGAESLKSLLSGPTALTFVHGDAAMAAKAIADIARVTQLLPFKGGLMNGDVLDADQIRAISRLPSREALYGQLVGVVASPISGLLRTLGALVGGLAVALGQVREKKESGEIPAGEPSTATAAAVAETTPSDGAPAEESSSDEAPIEQISPATETAEEPKVEEAAAEEAPDAGSEPDAAEEPQAEAVAAEEASTTENQAEPATESAQDDNQADASAQEPDSAEATKED